MIKKSSLHLFIPLVVLFVLVLSCNNKKKAPVSDIAASPEQLDEKATRNIKDFLDYAMENDGDIGDSVKLSNLDLLKRIYEKKQFVAAWSSMERWKPLGDSLLHFIADARAYGLFPEDYHYHELDAINQRFFADTGRKERRDAALWSKADLMLTDAFIKIVKDVDLGRLPKDSVTTRKDTVRTEEFYLGQWVLLEQTGSLTRLIRALEPKQKGYLALKAGIRSFLDSSFDKTFTFVPPMGKDSLSKAIFVDALQTRLVEAGYLQNDSVRVDSATLANAVKRFQKEQGIVVDGKAGEGTLRLLNFSNREKFLRIAISMDKYKQLPDSMPSRYLWVNLPSYYMELLEGDTVKIRSKIVCGKTKTRTPLLTSAISEMITYPQWTVPNSIIVKEILPAAKKDPGYFAKKGFSLVDKDGNEVDPYTVEWAKYSKGIPYKVVQGSGDDNALGVLKFNFNNKYAVYLHDTNQRYLFAQGVRSLSHGCVRVQEWEKLAYDILEHDYPDELKLQAKQDSLTAWLLRKEKHSIGVRNRLPVYFRYLTAEGTPNGKIVFYDDMYGEDRDLQQKYFAGK